MKRKILETFILLCIVPALTLGADKNLQNETKICAAKQSEKPQDIKEPLASGVISAEASADGLYEAVLTAHENAEKNAEEFWPVQMFTNTTVNLRAGNGTDTEIIDVLHPNVPVTVTNILEDWAQITTDSGQNGFIADRLLSECETPVSELNRWGIALNGDEIELLAKIVWKEAEGESQQGKEAVVEIILNRMISKEFGGDLYSVLSSRGQFSSWKGRNSAVPGQEAFKAIEDVLNGRSYNIPIDYLYFSTTKANGKDFIQIGRHYFGR